MLRRRRPRNADSLYSDSPAPDYGKGPEREGNRGHAGVRRGAGRFEDRSEAGSRGSLQGEGGCGSDCECAGQGTPPREVRRISTGLEEGLRSAQSRREAAGVREQLVKTSSQFVVQGSPFHANLS